MIRFLVRSLIAFLIIVVLLAGVFYFIDKEFLLTKVIMVLPTDTPISLGRVSLLIDETSGNILYGFEIVDMTNLPIQRTIKAEYAQVDYDADSKVVNIVLHNGTVEEKNMKNITEVTNSSFDQQVITIDPQEIKDKLGQLHKHKDDAGI